MSLLTVVHGRGTTAAKPAAAAANEGYIYFDTTLGKLQRSNGTTWDDISETSAGSGSITASGYTQTTARLLGRTTAATGAIEEITVGAGLSLSAGALTASSASITSAVNRVETDQSTTSTTFVDLTTAGPAVTLTANTKAMVSVSCGMYSAALNYGSMGYAVSGATTIAADRAKSYMQGEAAYDSAGSRVMVLTGLTPGSTTFTAKYLTFDGGTVNFRWREISVLLLD